MAIPPDAVPGPSLGTRTISTPSRCTARPPCPPASTLWPRLLQMPDHTSSKFLCPSTSSRQITLLGSPATPRRAPSGWSFAGDRPLGSGSSLIGSHGGRYGQRYMWQNLHDVGNGKPLWPKWGVTQCK